MATLNLIVGVLSFLIIVSVMPKFNFISVMLLKENAIE